MTFGIASVDYFEVTDGLMPGDEVVISDMREYQRLERVAIRNDSHNHDGTKARRRDGSIEW